MKLCVAIPMCVYACARACECLCVRARVCVVCVRARTYTNVTYVCIYKKKYINTYEHICMYINEARCSSTIHVYLRVCVCVCARARAGMLVWLEGVLRACVGVCAYKYIHIYMMTSYIDINEFIHTYKHTNEYT